MSLAIIIHGVNEHSRRSAAAVEGTRASAAIVASSALSRAAGVSAILAVGVDCWTAGLLSCDSVLLCRFPVVLGFGVCCALNFQGAISLLSWSCFADRFSICSLTGTYTPIGPNMVIDVSVQYSGGLLPDILLLTLCDSIGKSFQYHVEFLSLQLMFPSKPFDQLEGLNAFRFFF